MADALYERDGDRYLPAPVTAGPWTAEAQHGGPVAALAVTAAEGHEPGEQRWVVTRLTLELLRPVPLAPLAVETAMLRPGRKVQLVGVTIVAGGREVARGTVLRARAAELDVPARVPGVPTPPPPPEAGLRMQAWGGGWEAFHLDGAEIRFVEGAFFEPGPAVAWIRLRQPIVAGITPSGAARAAAAADFGNGVSSVLDFARFTFINPDLTVALARPPVGEWIALDALTLPAASGTGIATSALFDAHGLVGRSVQTLLVEER